MTRAAAGRSRRPLPRGSAPVPSRSAPGDTLEPLGWVTLAAWTLALVFASPSSTALWGLNGFRTVSGAWPALILAAALAWGMAAWKPRAAWPWLAVGAILVLVLALPMRETVHVLGDTQLRLRALYAVGLPSLGSPWSWLAQVSNTLHAAPLDMALDVLPPLALHAWGLHVADAVAWVDAVLAAVYFWLAWRLAHRLAPGSDRAGPVALALILTGVLEAFAGYADSAALIALVAVGWWGEILPPLERRGQAWWATAWFAALALTHRVGLVMVAPQLLRALGPPILGDRPEARRTLLALTVAVVTVVVGAAFLTGAGRQLVRDAAELARSASRFEPRPLDVLSALVVVAPLALAAPGLAGVAGASFWRQPQAAWIAAGALPLLIGLAWLFPLGENGLGAHRDWDTNVLLGVTLMVGAAAWLAHAGGTRLDRALAASLPLLALTALSWVAVNADAGLATRRAIQMATSTDALTGPQRAHLDVYFGQRAMDDRRPDVAAQHYERAFQEGGNPRRALLAAEAWLMSGRPDAARAAIAAARKAGPLSAELEGSLRELEAQMTPLDSASTR